MRRTTYGRLLLSVALMAGSLSCRHVAGLREMNDTTHRNEDIEAIERLHEADRRATLALDADALIDLWTQDGVMLRPGTPPVVGKKAIAEIIRAWNPNPEQVTIIRNDIDFREIEILGDWAFEYGTYESVWQESGSDVPETVSGNLLRILRRQPDGCWKCARAIWTVDDRP